MATVSFTPIPKPITLDLANFTFKNSPDDVEFMLEAKNGSIRYSFKNDSLYYMVWSQPNYLTSIKHTELQIAKSTYMEIKKQCDAYYHQL